MLWQIFQAYPAAFIFTVLVPIIGGLGAATFGSWGGYENLKHQFNEDERARRIEEGVNAIRDNKTELQSTLHVLESYNDQLQAAGKRDAVLIALINKYQQLSRAAALFGQMSRSDPSQDQGKVAVEILKISNQDVVHALVSDDLLGKPLVIELAPNSFRVINPVPMRIPSPHLTFTGLPEGVSPVVSDKSEISFTVSFLPLSIPVKTFGVRASADF